MVTNITSLDKRLKKKSDPSTNLYQKLVPIQFQEYVTKGFYKLIICGDIVYKLRTFKGSNYFISSKKKKVKPLRLRKYDSMNIVETKGLLGPSTAMYRVP